MQKKKTASAVRYKWVKLASILQKFYENNAMNYSNIQSGYTDVQMGIKKSVNQVIFIGRGLSVDNRFV